MTSLKDICDIEQNNPVTNDNSDIIWPKLKADIEKFCSISVYQKDLIDSLEKRVELGFKNYGVYLKTNNGRNAIIDTLQELLDSLFYLKQSQMEGKISYMVYHSVCKNILQSIFLLQNPKSLLDFDGKENKQ